MAAIGRALAPMPVGHWPFADAEHDLGDAAHTMKLIAATVPGREPLALHLAQHDQLIVEDQSFNGCHVVSFRSDTRDRKSGSGSARC